jgi:hypothetical protein
MQNKIGDIDSSHKTTSASLCHLETIYNKINNLEKEIIINKELLLSLNSRLDNIFTLLGGNVSVKKSEPILLTNPTKEDIVVATDEKQGVNDVKESTIIVDDEKRSVINEKQSAVAVITEKQSVDNEKRSVDNEKRSVDGGNTITVNSQIERSIVEVLKPCENEEHLPPVLKEPKDVIIGNDSNVNDSSVNDKTIDILDDIKIKVIKKDNINDEIKIKVGSFDLEPEEVELKNEKSSLSLIADAITTDSPGVPSVSNTNESDMFKPATQNDNEEVMIDSSSDVGKEIESKVESIHKVTIKQLVPKRRVKKTPEPDINSAIGVESSTETTTIEPTESKKSRRRKKA